MTDSDNIKKSVADLKTKRAEQTKRVKEAVEKINQARRTQTAQ